MIRMLIALLGGMLIGLERERAQVSSKAKPSGSIPGLRSFGLLSVYGALSLYMASLGLGGLLVAIGFSSIVLLVLLYAYSRLIRLGVQGVTTYIVMMITFLIGGLAGYGYILESAGISVLTTLTLALKHPAEKAASAISYNELLAMIEVAALALILGPIVKSYSESAGIGIAFKAYLFFIIILMLSLTTYMAARVWGARGILYSSILGALVNSEATITSILEKAESAPESLVDRVVPLVLLVAQLKLVALAVVGIVIFSGTINPELLVMLILVSLYFGAASYFAYIRVKRYVATPAESTLVSVEITSPVSWSTAVKGAAAYTVIAGAFILLSKARIPLQETAPILFSFIGGLVSATAVILSLGTTLGSMPLCSTGASIMAVLASVSLNKILYAQAARTRDELRRIVYKWSLLLSIVPLALMIPFLAAC